MARLNPDLLSGESLTYDLGPKLWALQTDLPLGFPRRGGGGNPGATMSPGPSRSML